MKHHSSSERSSVAGPNLCFLKTSSEMRPFSTRSGFTLIELLVVIAIIAVLVSLLLPAVQNAREAARRTQCKNHLKQMSTSLHNFHDTYNHFPSNGWGIGWAPHPGRGAGNDQPGSWMYQILPFMEQTGLYKLGATPRDDETSSTLLNGNVKRLSTPISIFMCPTRRGVENYRVDPTIWFVLQPRLCGPLTVGARNDYSINGGEDVAFYGGPSTVISVDNGSYVFPPPSAATGVSFVHSKYNLRDLVDGSSQVYLVGEKSVDPRKYYDGSSLGDDEGPYVSDERDTTRWTRAAGTSLRPHQDTSGVDNTWGFGSAHSGTLHMSFADGRVSGINYNIDVVTHRRLSNRRDRQVVGEY